MGMDDQVSLQAISEAAEEYIKNLEVQYVTNPIFNEPTVIRDAFATGVAWALDQLALRTPPSGVSHETSWEFAYYIRLTHEPFAAIRFIRMESGSSEWKDIQDAVEALYEDPAVMRVYQLRPCYGIGRRRGE